MVIKIGNIFESSAKTLVNTVNCVGIMGKGIALEFKNRYPKMFSEYVKLCKNGKVIPGVPYFYQDLSGISIINFPTKNHWRSPSQLSYIISGLDWFRNNYQTYNIESVAFPPLGCGNGGLSWETVGPIMYSKLNDLPIQIEIYAPYGAAPQQITEQFLRNSVANKTNIIGEQKKKINKNWLLILEIIKRLNQDKYSLNVGRTIFQKVCYLLTRTGVQTGFHFSEGQYGPYSVEVKQALESLSNANLMTERRLGNMVETIVSPSFQLDIRNYSSQELTCVQATYDLLSRIQSTDQAEMIATVLFSYDELLKKNKSVTEKQIFEHVLHWKNHWKGTKESEIVSTIKSLSMLGWMKPDSSHDTMGQPDDDWLY